MACLFYIFYLFNLIVFLWHGLATIVLSNHSLVFFSLFFLYNVKILFSPKWPKNKWCRFFPKIMSLFFTGFGNKFHIISFVSAQIEYLVKFWLLIYEPECCQSFRLQNFLSQWYLKKISTWFLTCRYSSRKKDGS